MVLGFPHSKLLFKFQCFGRNIAVFLGLYVFFTPCDLFIVTVDMLDDWCDYQVFSGVRVNLSLVLLIVVCPFVLFLLVIVLSVLLRYTDSDYLPLVSSHSSCAVFCRSSDY